MELINKINAVYKYSKNVRKDVPMVTVKDSEKVPDEPMVEEDEVKRLNDLIKLYINSVVKYENKLDYKDDKGNTALIVAIQTENEDIANALINAGADVTIKNNDNRTALFYAIRMDMPEIYKQLEEKAKEKKNLKSGGKKRKTKKGKRGNKSKESRKGKKSRKERKYRKGKKV